MWPFRRRLIYAADLAEEVKHASRTVPRMMVVTIILNGALGLVMVITYCFCVTDVEAMYVTTHSPFPFIDVGRHHIKIHADFLLTCDQVLYAGTGSTAGTIAMVSIVSALNICANLSIVAAGSRQAWAFARDEGLPFSSWFRRVSTIGIPIPINAILASLTITIAISLLNLGSTTAFLSVVGLLASAGAMSYAISISCVLWRRLRGKPLPKSPFSLGRYVSSNYPISLRRP